MQCHQFFLRRLAVQIAGSLVALVVFAMTTTRASAQTVGTIEGTVTSARDSAAVGEVTVFVEGHMQLVQTDARGRFRLSGVAAGTQAVTAQRIGYRQATEQVTVPAGGNAQVTFRLSEAATVMEGIAVTASRAQEEKLKELPVTVSVLSGEEIANQRPTHVGETLNRLAGVHVVNFDGDGSHNSVRQPLCCRASILLMEDGVPFAPPSFYTTSMLGGVDYAQSGQIEALKGPGTAAYGSLAVTGAINFLTPTPPVTPRADISVEGGQYNYKRALVSTGGTFGDQGLQLNGTFVHTDGRMNNPYQRLNGSLHWNSALPNGAMIRTVVTYNKRDGTGTGDQDPTQFQDRSSFNPYPIAFDNWRNLRASTSYQQTSGQTSWSVTPYFRYQNSSRVPGWQLSYNPVVWDINYRSAGFLSQVRHDFTALQAQVTAGIEADYSPLDRTEPVITPVPVNGVWTTWSLNAQPPHYDYRATYGGGAGYAQLEFTPVRNLRVSAGARFDAAGYQYHTRLPAVQTGSFRVPGDTSLSYRKATPKFGLTYSLSQESKLFASYRRGFRVPLENELFEQNRSANTTGLAPVQVESVEFGVRTGSARGRIEVAGYYMRLHNDILSYRDPNGASALANNGETSHRGIEVTGGLAFTSDLRADLAYTYALHRFEVWAPSSTLNLAGNEMDGAPHSLVSGTMTYEPRLLNGGRVQLEWSGMSSYWMDPANTMRFGSYNVFHLRASYVLAHRVELYARLMNLTNKLYAVQAFIGSGSIPWTADPGEYRTLYFGTQIRL